MSCLLDMRRNKRTNEVISKTSQLSFPFSSANPPECGQAERVGSPHPESIRDEARILLKTKKDSGQAGMTNRRLNVGLLIMNF
jgi:hypothetical protein